SGPRASFAARSRARSNAERSGGATASTSPMRKASSAGTWRPVRIRSLAREAPTSRGRRWLAPPPGMIPSRISGWPSLALAAATPSSPRSPRTNSGMRGTLTGADDLLGRRPRVERAIHDGFVQTVVGGARAQLEGPPLQPAGHDLAQLVGHTTGPALGQLATV